MKVSVEVALGAFKTESYPTGETTGRLDVPSPPHADRERMTIKKTNCNLFLIARNDRCGMNCLIIKIPKIK